MKQNEVKIGKRYIAKISGNITVVEIKQPIDRGTRQRRRLHWQAVNLKTGRDVEIKSATALRREADNADVQHYAGG